jgi:predicted glycosyltransferase involved in capsule biosynthesis
MTVHKLAVIVPYRDRAEHLKQFLPHMKNYLSTQNVEHTIYIIEQEEGKPFNRAKLLNVGFMEMDSSHDYVVFHDVDMLPQQVNYAYEENPTHLATAASQFNNSLPYEGYFGGVTMFSIESFKRVNGYSNEYWGWGAEDDDMLYRCHLAGLKVQRQTPGILRSLSHDRNIDQDQYQKNTTRIREMWAKKLDWENEGMNTCKYSVLNKDANEDRILVRVSI